MVRNRCCVGFAYIGYILCSAEEKFGKEQWEKVEALKDKYLDVSLNPTGIEQCERLQKSINKGMSKLNVILIIFGLFYSHMICIYIIIMKRVIEFNNYQLWRRVWKWMLS